MPDYIYRSLTSAIGDKSSPLRQYFERRFPNARPVQKDYRSRIGELRVPAGSANGGTLGAAFDFRMRFLLDPSYVPWMAIRRFEARPDHVEAIHEIIHHAREAAEGSTDPVELDRACWALALLTEVYHTGGIVWPGSPLSPLLEADQFAPEQLLALLPEDGLRQLTELSALAQGHLLPHLHPPFTLGPTFDGSVLCPADADVISDGLLLDFKAGVKGNALSREDLYQLLGYTLFDRSDRNKINRIGIYSARFASLVVWDLEPTLEVLAGEPVSLAQEREKVWGLLGGDGAIKPIPARGIDADDAEADDYSARGEDDDSGYGPDSYYSRAMGKDD